MGRMLLRGLLTVGALHPHPNPPVEGEGEFGPSSPRRRTDEGHSLSPPPLRCRIEEGNGLFPPPLRGRVREGGASPEEVHWIR